MQTIYLAMEHPEHLYIRGAHLEAGTVEEAFDNRKAAADFVAEKNKKATYSHWSVKAKRVKSGAKPIGEASSSNDVLETGD